MRKFKYIFVKVVIGNLVVMVKFIELMKKKPKMCSLIKNKLKSKVFRKREQNTQKIN